MQECMKEKKDDAHGDKDGPPGVGGGWVQEMKRSK